MLFLALVIGAPLALVGLVIFASIIFRRVVPANMVHIVQSNRKTVSFGSGNEAGNTYYAWPAWLPFVGVSISSFPISNFDLRLNSYSAYDRGRLPFVVDVMAFFRIADSTKAASRVSTFAELREQLSGILEGVVRRVLAVRDLEDIMQDRSQLADEFTKEVNDQLAEWGVKTVKAIEFMSITDAPNSKVIANIMSREQSRIESEARIAVATNGQAAQEIEINAKQVIDLRQQESRRVIGMQQATVERETGIAQEESKQQIIAAQALTMERQMEVERVNVMKKASIEKDRTKIEADAYAQRVSSNAEADLSATRARASGIADLGRAEGEAETARLLAPVTAQAKLAEEIGGNQSYQAYLIEVRKVESHQAIGVEMARSIGNADLKVIANSGDIGGGMTNLVDMLSSAGGTRLSGMLTALAQTEEGRAVVEKITANNS